MLRDRHELDVGEAHLRDVIGQRFGHLAVGQRAIAVVGHAQPRAEMDLVDGNRRRQAVRLMPASHPVVIVPGVVEIPDDTPVQGATSWKKPNGSAFSAWPLWREST